MNLRSLSAILIALSFMCLAVPGAQLDPKPPPGGRKEPGLFGNMGPKKDKDEPANTRAVAGYVHNASDEPVEGAVVQLKDTKSLKVRSFITQADGIYRFFSLSTNVDYELRADFKDTASEMRTLSVYDERRRAIINLKLLPKSKEAKK